ncbi:aspartyl-tRNA(Asn)/glutamyl-tRNA(Gln) amidotransferase subunit A [Rhodospirillales bacterium URHD0017]|nr:aspartyl-tRNA(Asn)/glutamyl-tRNA(Gln) amidotransferase subunit A [Rhodospirillales bacterium URHD0017]
MSILTIAEAAKLIAAKKLSPVELAKTHLDRIGRLDPQLNAFLMVTAERALADAKAAEARQMSGSPRGKLDGIPIAHKDIYGTAGIRTTAHSKLLKDNVPTRDARTVAKWAEAGTVMLGKLSTHEFAFGGPSFDLPWPPARNPWNREHFTAGSSSGTGAAVAAGLIMGGTGSDTGGSIRGPAALCGIAGIKPTYGRCSRVGILPLAYSLDHAGPMAWTAEDCALLLQGMAGHDPEDPASADRPVPDFTAELGKGAKGLRIGVVRHFFETDNRASDATRAGIDGALDFFRKEGAEVRDITLSPMIEYFAVGWLIMITEAFALHGPWLRERFMDYSEMLRDRVALAAMVTGPDIVQATRRRRMLCREMAEAMADLDVIVMASAPAEAPRIDNVPKWSGIEKPSFTMPCNVTGFPAISICTGFGQGGLPVSMQLAGKPFTEPTLFRAAHAYETAMPWRSKRPAMAA